MEILQCSFDRRHHTLHFMVVAALLIISTILLHGIGSAQSVAPGTNLSLAELRASAEKGDAKSQYLLGLQYSKGAGIPQDKVQGYMWLHLAAEQGHSQAVFSRYEISTTMTQDEITQAKRLAARVIRPKQNLEPLASDTNQANMDEKYVNEVINDCLLLVSLIQGFTMPFDNVIFKSNKVMLQKAKEQGNGLMKKYSMEDSAPKTVIMPEGSRLRFNGKLLVIVSRSTWVDPIDLFFDGRGTFPHVSIRGGNYDIRYDGSRYDIQIEDGLEAIVNGKEWIFKNSKWERR